VSAAWAFESAKFLEACDVVPATVGGVGRRGKYLVITLDGGRELIVHLGMTGQLRVRPAGGDRDRYVRASWDLDDEEVLEFRDVRRFGRIAVVPAGEYGRLATLAALGPEPFDTGLDGATLWRSLRSSHRHIKTQLLSQRPIAGVGNIYADEALWLARVHPAARRITRARAGELLEAIRQVLAAGIEHGGTTLRDYVDSDGRQGTNQLHLRCYGRAGGPCERCGELLVRRVIDARTTTWCPHCQRLR